MPASGDQVDWAPHKAAARRGANVDKGAQATHTLLPKLYGCEQVLISYLLANST